MRLILNKCRFFKLLPISLIVLMALFACSEGGETVTPAVQPTTAPASQAQPTQASPTAAPAAQSQPTTAPTAPPQAPAEQPVEPVEVVTTTNIVADWAQVVGGDRANVRSLLPAGADPHAYQPGAQDVAAIADADLVLAIGLGLEESWLHELLENAARDEESLVEVAEVIEPIEFGETHAEEVEIIEAITQVVHEVEDGEISAEEGLHEIEEAIEAFEEAEEAEDHHGDEEDEDEDEDDHGDEEDEDEEEHGDEDEEGELHLPDMVLELIAQVEAGQLDAEEAIEEIEHLTEEGEEEHEDHGHGQYDPHFWFDPIRVKIVINDIAARLSVVDPDGRDTYTANAADYGAQLDELHAWTQEQVSEIPDENKFLVTSHESLGYFAVVYNFEVVGVILSTTTEVDPSPADMAELAHEVEEAGISVIFGETTVSERLAEAIAAESGAEVVRLYSGSLGAEGSGAETYLDMVRTNVERIVEALK